ncbi:winged helix-turn-helix domain-containing protein [Stanieria cyanosphaera]|nr:winged helix-turn-helix domain-containing protein [Stanieria cyanosphaera]
MANGFGILDFYNNSNVVDVYIGYLRRKIDRDYSQQLIHTIRGVVIV